MPIKIWIAILRSVWLYLKALADLQIWIAKNKIKKSSNLLKYLFAKDHFKWSEQFKADFQMSVFTAHTLLQLVLNAEQLQCEFM